MNVSDFITLFRTITGDNNAPYFWPNTDIVGYLNQAEREAARRALLISDSTFSLSVSANDPTVRQATGMLLTRRARLSLANVPLAIVSWKLAEQENPMWDTVVGTPRAAIPDYQTGFLFLYPVPPADDTLLCTAYRLPKADMVTNQDSPEIPVQHHRALIDHVLELAYAKHDAETFNPDASKFYGDRFTASFGPPTSVIAETRAERDTSRQRYET